MVLDDPVGLSTCVNLSYMLLLPVYPAPHQVLVVAVACESNTVGWFVDLMSLYASVCDISFICTCH